MPLPDRPVDGAEIATDWGQEIHDYTFAPSGAWVHGAVGNVSSAFSKHVLATVDEDPGGFLDAANNQVEIPTGKEGLYTVFVQMHTVNGSAGAGYGTRAVLRLNGADVSYGKEENNGATNITFSIIWVGVLAAGDILSVYSQRIGAGTNPDVNVDAFVLYRVGAEFGA
jgi:hypothetical protein